MPKKKNQEKVTLGVIKKMQKNVRRFAKDTDRMMNASGVSQETMERRFGDTYKGV